MFADEESSEMQEEEELQRSRKESDLSVASDIDMDELERSLEEAQSVPRSSPEGKESEDRKPFIRPLEYDESDFEDDSSEQTPLSIIQEEDEEDLSESIPFPSNISRSHSASEGFESDDDVMDLLEDDEPTGQGMDFGSVRKISQTGRTSAQNSQTDVETSDGMGFGKYLAQSSELPKADASLDIIRLEDDQSELGENDGLEHTYSDTEADHRGVERSSTPLDDEQGMEQQEEALRRSVYDDAAPATETQAPSDEGYVGEMAPEEQVRVFLALYDYDPSTMSPNPGAEEEELAFNEGDLIKVRKWSATPLRQVITYYTLFENGRNLTLILLWDFSLVRFWYATCVYNSNLHSTSANC